MAFELPKEQSMLQISRHHGKKSADLSLPVGCCTSGAPLLLFFLLDNKTDWHIGKGTVSGAIIASVQIISLPFHSYKNFDRLFNISVF